MVILNLFGNLINEPAIIETKTGKSFCRFTIAVNNKGREEQGDLYECTAWGSFGEKISKERHKGDFVFVIGRDNGVNEYTNKNGEQVRIPKVECKDIICLFSKDKNRDKGQETEQSKGQAVKVGEVEIDEGDIPF